MKGAKGWQSEEVPWEGHGQAGPPGERDSMDSRMQGRLGEPGGLPPPPETVMVSGRVLGSEDRMLALPMGPSALGL